MWKEAEEPRGFLTGVRVNVLVVSDAYFCRIDQLQYVICALTKFKDPSKYLMLVTWSKGIQSQVGTFKAHSYAEKKPKTYCCFRLRVKESQDIFSQGQLSQLKFIT